MTSLDSLLDQIEERQKVEGQIQVSTNATSLEFLQAIYRDPMQPVQRRMRAASAALPFERPTLSAIAVGTANDLADRLMHALQASAKVINGRAMQVIEAPKAEQVIEAEPDHSGPFAQNSKHRWRRF
jgi:hypothetical protein